MKKIMILIAISGLLGAGQLYATCKGTKKADCAQARTLFGKHGCVWEMSKGKHGKCVSVKKTDKLK